MLITCRVNAAINSKKASRQKPSRTPQDPSHHWWQPEWGPPVELDPFFSFCQCLLTAWVRQGDGGWHAMASPANYLFGQRSNTPLWKWCSMFMQVWAFHVPKSLLTGRTKAWTEALTTYKNSFSDTEKCETWRSIWQMFSCSHCFHSNEWMPSWSLVSSSHNKISECTSWGK